MSSIAPVFLFVNKYQSSETLTRTEGSEQAHVQSHAQRLRRRREKGSENTGPEALAGYTLNLAVDQQRKTHPKRHQTSAKAKDALTLTKCPLNNGSDPFSCTVAGRDVDSHPILQFISRQASKTTFLAEAFAPLTAISAKSLMRHDKVVEERLKHCIHDKALMYSTLAYGSSLLAWMAGVVDTSRPPEYFLGAALTAVRRRLSGTSDKVANTYLALSIYSLAITELWTQMPPLWSRCRSRYATVLQTQEPRATACRTHLNALVSFVESCGGWSAFDPYILESAILADKFLAMWEWEPPIISLAWIPTKTSRETSDEAASPLGQKFADSPICGELKQVIRDVVDYVHMAQQYWSDPARSGNQSSMFLRLQELEVRLLVLENLQGLDHCVRCTALMFLLSVSQYHGSQIMARIVQPRLRSALVAARFWQEDFDSGIRFWCLCIAALSAESSSEKDWFLCMLKHFSGDIVPYSVEHVQQVMMQYLFLPDRQKASLVSLMEG